MKKKIVVLTESDIHRIVEESVINLLNESKLGLNILYHGSPYKFENFSLSKINTGQHSQDFGKGLYFTTDKETAIFYANELSNTETLREKYDRCVHSFIDEEGILSEYIDRNYTVAVKRLVNGFIQDGIGDAKEWEAFLDAINSTNRYGYVYTVRIDNPNYININEYNIMKRQKDLTDDEMNDILKNLGYNGIVFDMNNRRTSDKDYSDENNVVIIDDSIIKILNREKVDFTGLLKVAYYR